ncbi:hypothetical protein KIH39_05510 [Telmatocola sphagniphila]|uniref:Clp R domain-containing protein n=1 Tax=Telmatocola sphagniphila TaxID=1123043 RepID=A0A8E6EZD9_9BACT|nr:hypothetical protein [Telmatocola sphagniphila]QVL33371.1 hypothetical protein KIH39_05510 [Telmatocola sphagniphila]
MDSLFAISGHLNRTLFSNDCLKALEEARHAARLGGWDNLRTPHLFIGILLQADQTIKLWAEYSKIDVRNLGEQLRLMFKESDRPRADAPPLHREFCSNGVIKMLQGSLERMRSQNRTIIHSSDIAVMVLSDVESVVYQTLKESGMNCRDLYTLLETAERDQNSSTSLA